MNTRWMVGMAAALLMVIGNVALAAESTEWPWTDQATCVAYRTHKDTLFEKGVEVLGRSCTVEVNVEQDPAVKRVRVSMTVPVKGFASGSWLRDRAVPEILGGEALAPVVFKSNWLEADAFQALLAGGSTNVGGELVIKGAPKPVSMVVSGTPGSGGTVLRARAATTFTQVGVTVPTAGPGGIFAQPKDDLELMGQLLFSPNATR